MRLRRSVLTSPGITRRRYGKGFAYYEPDGSPLTDEPSAQRIEALVIPPAWKKVWISPFPNGHIQAVGTDAAGRRQYLYHQRWRQERAEEKFDRVLELSTQLPQWRARVAEDLAGHGLSRERVLALALHLLDRGYFRAGGEQYAQDNESYGIATLLCEHVNVRGCAVAFDYPAKSGVQRRLELEDPAVAKAVRALLHRGNRTERLLVCRAATGWADIRADDLNARFKELVGEAYSVKDLRTWHGTVLAAEAFADADPASSKRDETNRGRRNDRSGRSIGQYPGGGSRLLRRSTCCRRIRAGIDDRGRRPPGGAGVRSRCRSSHSGARDPDIDQPGRQRQRTVAAS